jgi:Ser-tRNA(Ala) deacylase AlaX
MTEPEGAGTFRTEKCYWADPYCAELDATVLDVRGRLVTLDRTIIYPFSGGQEQDRGFINGHPVVNVFPRGKKAEYELDPDHGLKPGERVRVRIDWDRRYRLMRLHFAAEIVLELVNRQWGRPEKIGAHIGEQKARLDFRWEGSIARILPHLAAELGKIVESRLPIYSRFENEEEEVRFWEVPGFGRVRCGGTHLRNTSEVGAVALRRDNIGKGKERIEIRLDPSA